MERARRVSPRAAFQLSIPGDQRYENVVFYELLSGEDITCLRFGFARGFDPREYDPMRELRFKPRPAGIRIEFADGSRELVDFRELPQPPSEINLQFNSI